MSSISNLFKFIKDYPDLLKQPTTITYSAVDNQHLLRYNIGNSIQITIAIGDEDEYGYTINTGGKWLPGKEKGKISTGLTSEIISILKLISISEDLINMTISEIETRMENLQL